MTREFDLNIERVLENWRLPRILPVASLCTMMR